MIPKYKIEIYDSSDNLRYTITEDAKIHVKEVVTDNVGLFSFWLPTVKGKGYRYEDVEVFDKAKFYFWYADTGSCPDTPSFIGKIYKITTPLNKQTGYVRIFHGKSLGEILQRQFIEYKAWEDVAASTIVTELANDLGLGTTEIETDSTSITLIVDHERYFDVLRKISDYWYDAGNQIKKDFYVDVDNNLVWKSRPFRTTGVETLTVGENVLSYNVVRSIEDVKNRITVYGEQGRVGEPGMEGRSYPSDGDAWTMDAVANWSCVDGLCSNILTDPDDKIVGAHSVSAFTNDDGYLKFKRTNNFNVPLFGIAAYQTLNFYFKNDEASSEQTHGRVELWAPNSSNYFYASLDPLTLNQWLWYSFALGQNQEYDEDKRPNAPWRKTGSPSWNRVTNICWYIWGAGYHDEFHLDGLHFGHGRWRSTVEDATSQTDYGIREYFVVDNSLKSDGDCEKRAQTLLSQLKTPPIRLDITTVGNTNIKVGDRLTVSIPAEGISRQAFDVIAVEHTFNDNGFMTSATMINTADTRRPAATTQGELLRSKFDVQKEIARGLIVVK